MNGHGTATFYLKEEQISFNVNMTREEFDTDIFDAMDHRQFTTFNVTDTQVRQWIFRSSEVQSVIFTAKEAK